MEELRQETCREYKRAIMVAPYSPHPKEREATGMAAHVWEDYEHVFVGWICDECAFASATKEGGGSISGVGGSMDFCY